ncbi:MAG: 16S rRNA (adenine(1518)-N(6)/adenine(1519)-N(6))-dimethyltransferase RsmA [Clostridiaceae bacterium]|nr:16S rRNA (adenine(1518)-N(6)/adenine(1519)-N(6))-dimethyltransferase RsmA [Clostridiaceae bacterium]
MNELYEPQYIADLLGRHGFTFTKSLGQNFLVEASVARRTAETVDRSCGVLEIGPGHGALTAPLCECAGKVVAAEADARLLPVLEETLAGYDNVTVRLEDATKLDMRALCETEFRGFVPCVCANLPYNVTTPILESIVRAGCFQRITVMVQKEVAQRLMTKPGDERWGVVPALLAARYTGRILFTVGRYSFLPPPHVDSAVITFERLPEPVVGEDDWDNYERVVRAAFAQRRKTLSNALGAAGITADILGKVGIDPRLRGERLLPEDFLKIARLL